MKKLIGILSVLLAIVMVAGLAALFTSAGISGFDDVETDRWSYADVTYAARKGYLVGVSNRFFDPEGAMTRAGVVTVLWRREGSPKVKYTAEFTDVPENAYYASAVMWAKKLGIVSGTTDTTFSPNGKVTREQLASMLMRYTAIFRYSTNGRSNLKNYTDADSVSSYASDAMAWAVKKGLITGTDAQTLSPLTAATREQFASIMSRYDEMDLEYSVVKAKIDLLYPDEGDEISVLNPLMSTFIRRYYMGDFDDQENPECVYDWLPEEDDVYYRGGKHDHTYPVFVEFKWTCDDPVRLVKLEISETEDFSTPADVTIGDVYSLSEGVYSCKATNFKIGTTYYWRIKTDFLAKSETRSFTTAADRYRPIYLEGGSNVRDLGGWVNAEGKQIRQGAIYRGAEPESYEFEDPHHYLTYEGRRQLAEDLGVKTRLDLQVESLEGEHFRGEWFGVEYYVRPCKQWQDNLEGEGVEWFREVMEVALDTTKYPLYFHCYAGADRTGTVAACLECLLGMDMEDIIFDFNVTSLTITSRRSFYRDRDGSRVLFFNMLAEMFPDVETPQERVEEYLVSIGISREKIEAFRDYMILDR